MKILVDATVFSRLNTGIARYERELFNAVLDIDANNNYVFFDLRALKNKLAKPNNPFKGQKFKTTGMFPRELYSRALGKKLAPPIDLLLGIKADIAIFPNYFLFPLAHTSKSIVFIYDLSFLHYPEFANKKAQKLLATHVPRAVKKATHVVTISSYVKAELIKQYELQANNVSVIYPAINTAMFYPRSEVLVRKTKNKFGITKPYIMFTGTLEPRKNIESLLSAYGLLSEQFRRKYCLVIVGAKGWRDTSLQSRLSKTSKDSVYVLGSVDDSELAALYSGAAIFVFPSHYEGFGMPPLEAMACGAPVIVANNSSLPEVVGSAAILVNANRPSEIKKSIVEVLGNKNLRNKMVKSGYKQIKKFNWKNSGEKLYRIINEISQDK